MPSQLNVDTLVAANGTDPVTLTKQEAVKHWVNYDATNSTTDGSLNQSSVTDYSAGEFASNFTNNFGSASDKCHSASGLNSITDGQTRVTDGARAGVEANLGVLSLDSVALPLSTSQIQFYSAYNANSTSNGSAYDLSAVYCTSIGDLA